MTRSGIQLGRVFNSSSVRILWRCWPIALTTFRKAWGLEPADWIFSLLPIADPWAGHMTALFLAVSFHSARSADVSSRILDTLCLLAQDHQLGQLFFASALPFFHLLVTPACGTVVMPARPLASRIHLGNWKAGKGAATIWVLRGAATVLLSEGPVCKSHVAFDKIYTMLNIVFRRVGIGCATKNMMIWFCFKIGA